MYYKVPILLRIPIGNILHRKKQDEYKFNVYTYKAFIHLKKKYIHTYIYIYIYLEETNAQRYLCCIALLIVNLQVSRVSMI